MPRFTTPTAQCLALVALARLALLRAVGQVVRNGLDVLGVSAPESM